jgi:hypothetical protein
MDNYVTYPGCKKTISHDLIIDEAATGAGSASRSINCECGERITYWAITAQLRGQKTLRRRMRYWWQSFRRPSTDAA